MKNTKKLLALLTVLSVLFTAGACSNDSKKDEPSDKETTEQTADESGDTDVSDEPKETEDDNSDDTSYDRVTNEVNADMSAAYHAYMDKASELNAENPDLYFNFQLLYSIEDVETYALYVTTADRSYRTKYVYDYATGEISELTEGEFFESTITLVFPYESFSKLPCMVNEQDSVEPFENVFETFDDGAYYGRIIAMSVDGDYALVKIGLQDPSDPSNVGTMYYAVLPVASDANITCDDMIIQVWSNVRSAANDSGNWPQYIFTDGANNLQNTYYYDYVMNEAHVYDTDWFVKYGAWCSPVIENGVIIDMQISFS